jgi:hypothetical protein
LYSSPREKLRDKSFGLVARVRGGIVGNETGGVMEEAIISTLQGTTFHGVSTDAVSTPYSSVTVLLTDRAQFRLEIIVCFGLLLSTLGPRPDDPSVVKSISNKNLSPISKDLELIII